MTQLEKVETKRCNHCNQWLPKTAFYPSVLKHGGGAQCIDCTSKRKQQRDMARYSEMAEKIYFAYGEMDWTSKQASAALGISMQGMGSKCHALIERNLVRQTSQGKYRVIPQSIRAERLTPRKNGQHAMALEVPAAPEIPAPTVEVIPQLAAQSKHEPKGLFLRAGSHLLSLPHIVDIEIAPDDSVSVMLNVQETRKDGYIAPVSFKFEGCDGRAIIDSISVLQGDLPAEQIKQYEDRCALAERDRDAALALAAELEKKLSDIRARLQ